MTQTQTFDSDRTTARDVLVGLAGIHAIVLVACPHLLVIGLGLWWNANTISHNFIHRPFFRSRHGNSGFSVALSLLLGLPQSIWRDRHIAHHAGVAPRIRLTPQLWLDSGAVAGLWGTMAIVSPGFFLLTYAPGIVLGLSICAIHGYYEHAKETESHYGRIYNFLFCNDGYHIEHHAHPSTNWRAVPSLRREHARGSRWPAVLRWLDHPLETLERLVLPSPRLQSFVLSTHRQAWRKLIPHLGEVQRIAIVGGGLFPRTAILLRELLPEAQLTIIDGDSQNLDLARQRLGDGVSYRQVFLDASSDVLRGDHYDLLVFPLDYRGESRPSLRKRLTGQRVVFHDWLWARHGRSALVSFWLLKRLNLVRAS